MWTHDVPFVKSVESSRFLIQGTLRDKFYTTDVVSNSSRCMVILPSNFRPPEVDR